MAGREDQSRGRGRSRLRSQEQDRGLEGRDHPQEPEEAVQGPPGTPEDRRRAGQDRGRRPAGQVRPPGIPARRIQPERHPGAEGRGRPVQAPADHRLREGTGQHHQAGQADDHPRPHLHERPQGDRPRRPGHQGRRAKAEADQAAADAAAAKADAEEAGITAEDGVH